ncbi:MAG: BON domain-containing protein [Planctomycetaceae bacterium]|nr:BON domain-containing protein [Planctomycetaceae bacterium]
MPFQQKNICRQFVAFLLFVALPGSLFAQAANETTVATEVQNLSAQGGFIGSGRPDAFVGVHEVYNRTSSASRTASTARLTTTTRPRAAATSSIATRQSGMLAGTGQLGTQNNQTVRSATALGFDRATFPMQRLLPIIETNLARIQGIQDGQVSFTNSPTGTTAVLTGTVSSERERRVAQQLLLLEPGINRVENRLDIR